MTFALNDDSRKDALVREMLASFFGHLIEVAGLWVFLHTVGVELAQKSGLSVTLLNRAQSAGAVRRGDG